MDLASTRALVISVYLEGDLCALVHLHARCQVIPAEVQHRLVGSLAPGLAGILHLFDLGHHVRRVAGPRRTLNEAPALTPVEDLHIAGEGARSEDHPVLEAFLGHRDAARKGHVVTLEVAPM